MTSTDDTTDAASRPDATEGATAAADTSGEDGSGLSYGRALEELESLLSELEEADVDVDRLAQNVARGVELVRFCRRRLAEVTADVDQVVADLVTDPGTESNRKPGAKSPVTDDGGGRV